MVFSILLSTFYLNLTLRRALPDQLLQVILRLGKRRNRLTQLPRILTPLALLEPLIPSLLPLLNSGVVHLPPLDRRDGRRRHELANVGLGNAVGGGGGEGDDDVGEEGDGVNAGVVGGLLGG